MKKNQRKQKKNNKEECGPWLPITARSKCDLHSHLLGRHSCCFDVFFWARRGGAAAKKDASRLSAMDTMAMLKVFVPAAAGLF